MQRHRQLPRVSERAGRNMHLRTYLPGRQATNIRGMSIAKLYIFTQLVDRFCTRTGRTSGCR